MNLVLIFKSFFIFSILVSTSCSGPQMISSPPPSPLVEASPTVSLKKESLDQNELKIETGVFDDENFQLNTDLKQWKLIDTDDGVKTYEKIKSNSGLVAFRGEIVIPAQLKKIASVLIEDSYQKDWVDSFVESKVISIKNDFEHTEYNQTKVPWPFQNRDFVFQVSGKVNALPATMLITMKSVEDKAAPAVEGIVRGEIIHSYYYLREKPNANETKMVVEMEVDPKGAIPMWLVNLSQKGWPHNTLLAVKKLTLKDNIKIHPKIEQYFSVTKKGKKK